MAKMSAAVPITPSVTPKPMPIFSPVDIPPSLAGPFEPEAVGDGPVVDIAGDADVKDEPEKLIEPPEGLGVEVGAPTLESRAAVVVSIVQSLDEP
ncbi:hypothetical protein J4E85_004087 [Alternaria conjuncta]|uniref:uncharacterized protein n=1 Tax=Alternaria triticimaculans TaxID=297637 RepID=UPI0020C54D92|nr:uncharacterized protein J4E78_005542 [Alternaria triticimaculans]XP_051327941.1 uncharacterized protein J4E85_004087 [Alternaria conjuncta]KAI4659118.1 hypothetical protein J4E78_005542 [Alternaria triticimaculans]KAI4931494.1 hypothetical protein J4E85_004087 [Alternaria conjuncta]